MTKQSKKALIVGALALSLCGNASLGMALYDSKRFIKAEKVEIVTSSGKRYPLNELYSVKKADGTIVTCIEKEIDETYLTDELLAQLSQFGITYYKSYDDIPKEIIDEYHKSQVLSAFSHEHVFVEPTLVTSTIDGKTVEGIYPLLNSTVNAFYSIEDGQFIAPTNWAWDQRESYAVNYLWNLVHNDIKPWDDFFLPLEKVKKMEKRYMDNSKHPF